MSSARFHRILPLLVLAVWLPSAAWAAFTYETVVEEAKAIAAQDYVDRSGEIPERLLNINYDQWRDIRFIPAKALWRDEGLPFSLKFFHPGLYYKNSVEIHIIDNLGESHQFPFSRELFDYKSDKVKAMVPGDLGFAGFRVHYPINKPEYQDEVAVFVGASYFRAVCQDIN